MCIKVDDLPETMSRNLNGPTCLKKPQFASSELDDFLLYFSQHDGQSISLMTSSTPLGPWRIVSHNLIQMHENSEFHDHVASPHVEVSHREGVIFLYFHSRKQNSREQFTFLYSSRDGLNFFPEKLQPKIPFYFRMIQLEDKFLAVTKGGDFFLNQNRSFTEGWTFVGNPFQTETVLDRYHNYVGAIRHACFFQFKDNILLFYSVIGDAPERIFASNLTIKANSKIIIENKFEVIRPTEEFEGASQELRPSSSGPAVTFENALRDPFVLKYDNSAFLYYSFGGETGLAVTQLEIVEY